MIEAELKARLDHPEKVRERLRAEQSAKEATYCDVYFDTPSGAFEAHGRELRVRTIKTSEGTHHVLTYKDPPVDSSGSKPEWETKVESAETTREILICLGYIPSITLTKYCENYQFRHGNLEILATLVTVPELDGTFLEIEIHVEPDVLDQVLGTIRQVFAKLGIAEHEFTSELYTDTVRMVRQKKLAKAE